MPDATSLIAPLLAIALAIWTRQVHLSLFAGIWVGATQLAGFQPLMGLADSIERTVATLADSGNAKVILFSSMVGAVIALTRHSGGVDGFVAQLTSAGIVHNKRRAMLLSWSIGLVIFIESSLTSLINGAICRPLFAKYKISKEKLAYLCDATSAPICILIPLNGWAAYILQLLESSGVKDPLSLFVSTIPLNFYAFAAAIGALIIVLSGRDFGPMRKAEELAAQSFSESDSHAHNRDVDVSVAEPMNQETAKVAPGPAIDFVLPILVMVLVMPIGLWATGDGDFFKGSGSTSVLWAVLAACFVASVFLVLRKRASIGGCVDIAFRGTGELVPLSLLLMLAFAIGQVTKDLGTGVYLSQLVSESMSPALVPACIFLVSCAIAFSTGTSWGTFALMIPIALPMLAGYPELLSLGIAAALSGGVFGDHCSPISDTTMISSLASGCDHVDHVTTQLPYALVGGLLSVLAFAMAGFLYL